MTINPGKRKTRRFALGKFTYCKQKKKKKEKEERKKNRDKNTNKKKRKERKSSDKQLIKT